MAWRSGRALGQDLRDRALADAGRPAREVAARFGVSASYVVKARQRLREEGDAAARPRRNRVAPRLAGHGEAIRAEVARRGPARRARNCVPGRPGGAWRSAAPRSGGRSPAWA